MKLHFKQMTLEYFLLYKNHRILWENAAVQSHGSSAWYYCSPSNPTLRNCHYASQNRQDNEYVPCLKLKYCWLKDTTTLWGWGGLSGSVRSSACVMTSKLEKDTAWNLQNIIRIMRFQSTKWNKNNAGIPMAIARQIWYINVWSVPP